MNKDEYLIVLGKEIDNQKRGKYYKKCCLQYAERLLENGLPVIFDANHFALLLGTKTAYLMSLVYAQRFHYSNFYIKKKSGGERRIDVPSVPLKYVQRWILDNILKNINVSSYALGFCNGRSIADNAKMHLNKDCVLNMDISDFFPSIGFDRVFMLFYYYGYTKEVSFILAKLCTLEDYLPQGSPASPYISNIVCLKLDKRLSCLAKKYEASYSRYADDITFSGNSGIKNCIPIISKIVKDEGFAINERKTHMAFRHQKQEVTGLIVNGETVRVDKKYKRELGKEIYFCKKYGVESHLEHIGCDKVFFKEHIYGKAFFVYMIEPNVGSDFLKQLDDINWSY